MVQVAPGLAGVVVAETSLSCVDGENGRLSYRGYDIADLATRATFEEIAYLLWHGQLPNQSELTSFEAELAQLRPLPSSALQAIALLPPESQPLDVLRTAISFVGAAGAWDATPSIAQAMSLMAQVPTVIAAFDRIRRGLEPLAPRAHLSHAANFLFMLSGEEPDAARVRSLDTYLILTADHGFNASTFTARVIASTLSDLSSAVVGAIGALKGPLHGGAPAEALDMLRSIGTPERAEDWLNARLNSGEVLMGFGHRVYKAEDPRARVLRSLAEQTSEIDFFQLATHVEDVALRLLAQRHAQARLYTNVEFYASAVLHGIGLPEDLFTPAFAVSRVVGWTAHVLEQLQGNKLIRPAVNYVGPQCLEFMPLAERR
jgi:citrate synthase